MVHGNHGLQAQEKASAQGTVTQQELDELGSTLKAAVAGGVLNKREAWGIWYNMAWRVDETGSDSTKGSDDSKGRAPDVKSLFERPRMQDADAIFEHEFMPRDLVVLEDMLQLDKEQSMIARIILEDYRKSFQLSASPLRDGIARYYRARSNRYLAQALERADSVEVNDAIENIRNSMKKAERRLAKGDSEGPELEYKRAEIQAWGSEMISVVSLLDVRLQALEDRVSNDLKQLEQFGDAISGDDLVELAINFKASRSVLRDQVRESLLAILNAEQAGTAEGNLDDALARIDHDRLIRIGRLGGESTNLFSAWNDSSKQQEQSFEDVQKMFRTWTHWTVQRLHAREKAMISREITGISYQGARDRIMGEDGFRPDDQQSRLLEAERRYYTDALKVELESSILVRDALLEQLEQICMFLEQAYPETDLASSFRDAAIRRGFVTEMRSRWAERAVVAALELPELDPQVVEQLILLEDQIVADLQVIREDSVARRLQRDPSIAREFLDGKRAKEFDNTIWYGVNADQFLRIDDQADATLQELLSEEQYLLLPRRDRKQLDDQKKKSSKTGQSGKKESAGSGSKSIGSGKSGK